MNRVSSPLIKFLLVVSFAMFSTAHAAEDKKTVKADPAKGETLYLKGDATRNITACVSCHGAAGNSTIAQNPKLAGQHDSYTIKQLADFKGGEKGPLRNNPIMSPIAKAMTDDDMRNVAAFLASQQQKPGVARGNKESIELGKKIYRGGIAEKKVPACAACHSANGAGMPALFARIGGQHQDYTETQLNSFRSGARNNSPQMTTIAKRLSEEEIKAVADYIAGLK